MKQTLGWERTRSLPTPLSQNQGNNNRLPYVRLSLICSGKPDAGCQTGTQVVSFRRLVHLARAAGSGSHGGLVEGCSSGIFLRDVTR